jgi:hypothetical protein
MRLRSVVASCLQALCLVIAVESQAAAQDTMPEKRPRVELGVGSWVLGAGETQWSHNASSIPGLGNPTSKLTYKDTGTNIVEVTGKLWFTPRLFGRVNVGVGNIGGGRLVDEDYGAGQRLFSSTQSDIDGVSTWYLNADFGGKVKEFANQRGYLELFGGYQYWYTKYNAVGLTQTACNPSAIPGITPCDSPGTVSHQQQSVIANTANWHSIRAGATVEYRLTRRLSVQGAAAFIPISIIDNKDVHRLRGDLSQTPSLSMLGYGIGADADVGARLMIIKNFFLSVGYRIWWNRMLDGNVTFHDSNGMSSEFPLTQFQTFRHGMTFGLNYSF